MQRACCAPSAGKDQARTPPLPKTQCRTAAHGPLSPRAGAPFRRRARRACTRSAVIAKNESIVQDVAKGGLVGTSGRVGARWPPSTAGSEAKKNAYQQHRTTMEPCCFCLGAWNRCTPPIPVWPAGRKETSDPLLLRARAQSRRHASVRRVSPPAQSVMEQVGIIGILRRRGGGVSRLWRRPISLCALA